MPVISQIVPAFVVVVATLYILFSIIVAFGRKQLRSFGLPSTLPCVSVIVCARNEETNLHRCLDNLLRLDYPKDLLEIVLVDDESDDNTLAIMRNYAASNAAIKVYSTTNEPHDFSGKQRPLNLAIRKSTGEFILITDADIVVQPGWIKGHLAAYDETTGIVGGTTRADYSSNRFFDHLQSTELASKFGVAMGCTGLGLSLSIMGNNMSFRRKAYDTIRGYGGMGATVVEDMALMTAVVTRTDYTLSWATSPDSEVTVKPEPDLTTFINQRFRWFTEVGNLPFTGKVLIGMEMLMGVALSASILSVSISVLPLLTTALAWNIGYAIFISPQSGKRKHDMLYIPTVIIFQITYGLVLIKRILFNTKTTLWKGRTYTKPAV